MKHRFPANFYQALYDAIMDEDYEPEIHCTFAEVNFELLDYEVDVAVWLNTVWVDDSFDHAFGTYHDGHFEVRSIKEIEMQSIYSPAGDEVTEDFDEDQFWLQTKRFYLRWGKDRMIKYGDEVIARVGRIVPKFRKCIFLYQDFRRGIEVVAMKRKNGHFADKRETDYVLPVMKSSLSLLPKKR